jgi:hypothetical protein
MGVPEARLNFRERIITRGGNDVRLYHVYEKEIHGAYEANGTWYIARWSHTGHFLPQENGRQPITTLDMINEKDSIVYPQSA